MLRKRIPLYGQIELTYRCIHHCIHCYCRSQATKELGYFFWKNIIDQVYVLGGIEIVFTGGDPVMHKDFLKIYRYAKRKGFLISLFITGYSLNKKILDALQKDPPLNIEITINSLYKEKFERIAQKKGTFDKIMANIQKIKGRKLPLTLKCNGLKENKEEIIKIKKFTEKLLGRDHFKYDSMVLPGLCGEKEPIQHRLSPGEVIEIEEKDKDMRKQRLKQIKHQNQCFNPGGLYHCNSWFSQYFINPEGLLQFCHLTKKFSTDLKKKPFAEGFNRFLEVLGEKYKNKSKCVDCQLKEYCYKCPVRGYLENGDEEQPAEYYCQVAKAYKRFGQGVRKKYKI